MKKLLFGLFAVLALVGTGCITTVDGHKEAGVPFRKDKIVSRLFMKKLELLLEKEKKTIIKSLAKRVRTRTFVSTLEMFDFRRPSVAKSTIDSECTRISSLAINI